jgi:DNA helicase HerA-like ATPase
VQIPLKVLDLEENRHDDIHVLDNWIEYDENKDKAEFIVYKMMLREGNEDWHEVYKVVKLGRLHSIPKKFRELSSLMKIHDDILSGFWHRDINFINVICNIMTPPLGLLFLYGVQEVAQDLEIAKQMARNSYYSVIQTFRGSMPQIRIKDLTREEADWLREKMFNMKYLQVVRGIPLNKVNAGYGTEDSIMGDSSTSDAEEQNEEFIRGMSDREFVMITLATPIDNESLHTWLSNTADELSVWQSEMQGTKGINAGISMPMVFMSNLGSAMSENTSVSEGISEVEGFSQGESVGFNESRSFSQSQGSTFGESFTRTNGQSFSQTESFAESQSQSVSQGQTFSQSQSFSQSESIGSSESFSQNFGRSQNMGFSENQGFSQNQSFGQSQNMSEGFSQNQSFSQNMSEGFSQNRSLSENSSAGLSYNQGKNQGFSFGENLSQNSSQGGSFGFNSSASENASLSQNSNFSQNYGINDGRNVGGSHNLGAGNTFGNGYNSGVGRGDNIGVNNGYGYNNGYGLNGGVNASPGGLGGKLGVSGTESFSDSVGINGGASETNSYGVNGSNGRNFTEGYGMTNGWSSGKNSGVGVSNGGGFSNGYGSSNGSSFGGNFSNGTGYGMSKGQSFGNSESMGQSFSNSRGFSSGQGYSQSFGQGMSTGQSISSSRGMGQSMSQGQGTSQGFGKSMGYGTSMGEGRSFGTTNSQSRGQTIGSSKSVSQTNSQSFGTTHSKGVSQGQSYAESHGQSQSTSQSVSKGTSTGVSQGKSNSHSQNQGTSYNTGFGQGTSATRATSSSMALGPSVSVNKTVQWFDANKETLAEIVDSQRARLKRAIQQGAYYVDVFVLTNSEDSKAAAGSLLRSAFWGKEVFPSPLQVIDPEDHVASHLMVHATAFSGCTIKEGIEDIIEGYRYTTILLPEEITSYIHTPRLEMGGLRTLVENIPYFSVPKRDDGEIYLGKIINPETGLPSQMKYTLRKSELMHGLVAGASGMGKTKTALQFINEIVNNMKLPALILDWKKDWRVLKYMVEPERFEFFGLGPDAAVPIKMNLFLPPDYVSPLDWRNKIIESLAIAFGLGNKQYGIMIEATSKLFWEYDIIKFVDKFDNDLQKKRDGGGILLLPSNGFPKINDNWKENINNVTLADLYLQLKAEKEAVQTFNLKDTYESILTRLGYYASGELRELYASTDPDAYSISDLIKDDKVMVLEGEGLDAVNKQFIIHLFAQGIFLYAKKRPIKQEMLIVFEEAHQVIHDQEKDIPLNIGEDVFSALMNESRGYGLYNLIIVQSPSMLPQNVVTNCSTIIAHKIGNADDAELLVKHFNRDEKFDNRDIIRWLYRQPIGQAVVKTSKVFDAFDSEPSLLQINLIPIEPPGDEELILHHNEFVDI